MPLALPGLPPAPTGVVTTPVRDHDLTDHMVQRVGYVKIGGGTVDRDAIRTVEQGGCARPIQITGGPGSTGQNGYHASRSDLADDLVAGIRHVHITRAVQRESVRSGKTGRKRGYDARPDNNFADTAVPAVGHVEGSAGAIHRDAMRTAKRGRAPRGVSIAEYPTWPHTVEAAPADVYFRIT